VNSLNTFLANAFTESKDIIGGVNITYAGDTVEGVFNTETIEASLIVGGLNSEYEATFLMANTDIVAAGVTFEKGKKATLQSKDWKIERIESGEVTTTLYLTGWHESTLNN
jgi:hypothetical protein